LTNCTIAGNYSETVNTGSGIFMSRGALSLDNTIVAANIGQDIGTASGPVTGSNNLTTFDDWNDGTANLIYDPAKLLFVDTENGDYRLAPNSQAINKGDNEYATTPFDLAGNRRIVGGIVDIGAYEYNTSLFVGDYIVVTTLDYDLSTGVPDINHLSLREALLLAKDGQIITFDPTLFDDGAITLTLEYGELTVTNSVSIIGVADGDGNNLLTIAQGDGKTASWR
jgi:hypothetical protein